MNTNFTAEAQRSKSSIEVLVMDTNNQAKTRTKTICRFCLKVVDTALYLTQDITTKDGSFEINLYTAIADVVPEINLKIIMDPKICHPCISLLKDAFSFRTLCLQSDQKLMNMLSTKRFTSTDTKSYVSRLQRNSNIRAKSKEFLINSINKKINSEVKEQMDVKKISSADNNIIKITNTDKINKNILKQNQADKDQTFERNMEVDFSEIKIEENQLNWSDIKEEINENIDCVEVKPEEYSPIVSNEQYSEKTNALCSIESVSGMKLACSKGSQNFENYGKSLEKCEILNQNLKILSTPELNLKKPLRTYKRVEKTKTLRASLENDLKMNKCIRIDQDAQSESEKRDINICGASSEIENPNDVNRMENGKSRNSNASLKNINEVITVKTTHGLAKIMNKPFKVKVFKGKTSKKKMYCQLCKTSVYLESLESFNNHHKGHLKDEVICPFCNIHFTRQVLQKHMTQCYLKPKKQKNSNSESQHYFK